MSDTAGIVVSRSTMADVAAWSRLASSVEKEFGARLAGTEDWTARLQAHINGGTACSARLEADAPMVGGMWLSYGNTDSITLSWLAVQPAHRRRGIGTALVEAALGEAAGRSVRVVTFGEGHPLESEADAARALYLNLGFEPTAEIVPDGPDGTPRGVFRHSS